MNEQDQLDPVALERLRRIGKGEKLLQDMIELFLQNAPHWVSAMRAGEQSGEFESLERAAHNMKSSAGTMGARAVQGLAGRIERLAKERDRAAVGPLLAEMEAALAPVETQLRELRKQSNA